MEIDFSSFSLEQPCLYDLPEFHDFVLDFSLQSNSITNHSNYNNDSPSSTEKDKSELIQFVMSCCSKFVEQNSDCFLSAPDLFQEVLSIIDKGRNQTMHSDSEMYFQDKLFQLLGENCFEFLSEMLSRFSDLQKLSTDSISSTDLISKAGSIHSATVKTTNTITTNLSTNQDWLAKLGFSEEYLSTERSLGLQKGNSFDVASWNLLPEGTRIHHEIKGLPMDTIKTVGPGFEEVFIPAARNPPIIPPGGLTSISTLEPWAQKAFVGTSSLNTIQSTVFPAVYNTSQNLLICAPTGAGKTNIAMLAILQLLRDNYTGNGHIDVSGVKAIYIAPMKALAQEIVARFSERLKSLGMSVRECTGDMQLTKQETMETNLIVTTPEKYDVISRKCTEGSLSTMVSLIIIDEVHLLADDRGAVIETIVARTHRYIESSQKRIRLVGLSATLPNYEDVAKFLRANLKTGLFYFGPEYRPVPLAQTLIGVTEKQKPKQKAMMNLKAYEKMIESLEKGKQVMIFVHSRKETSETANAMVEFSAMRGTLGHFDSSQHEKYGLWKKDVDKAHSEEVQNLFYKGVGIHHAGMMRSDRTLTENLFQYGLIKVLCCTATLAWGVNLPANTVIIKGTELYDPERGGFVDLSILDVLQIFGRAGRPQYDTSGNAVLITPHKSLDSYLALLGHQSPIESGLIKSLADHLNAEIVNGTVANVNDAIAWLTYTFLFVRMCKNPLCYGLKMDDVMNDPQLTEKRRELIVQAAQLLDRCMMCRYDPGSGNLGVNNEVSIKLKMICNFNDNDNCIFLLLICR